MGIKISNLFKEDSENEISSVEEEFYSISEKNYKEEEINNGSKMILVEPRAYSESQTIADHLKKRNSVVVNLKRVTNEQAKRIIDFLYGCIYAIGGDLQKLGSGIYLCTPKNVSVQGKISESDKSKKMQDELEF